jgi:Protein of unknown function (DUF2794)
MSFTGRIVAFPGRRAALKTFFTRAEMSQILGLYAMLVAAGKLKDYAIFEARAFVTFSFFGRAAEKPLYRIVKDPRRGPKRGRFRILGPEGQVLKEGESLKAVLAHFSPMLLRLVPAAGE